MIGNILLGLVFFLFFLFFVAIPVFMFRLMIKDKGFMPLYWYVWGWGTSIISVLFAIGALFFTVLAIIDGPF